MPCGVDSFSVVAWSKLGLYEEYQWGRAACFSLVVVKPGLVMLLPEEEECELSVCLELAPNLVREFDSHMMEDFLGPLDPQLSSDITCWVPLVSDTVGGPYGPEKGLAIGVTSLC